jgi:hypothetical protein
MIPSSVFFSPHFFDIESWQILTKFFSKISRICTTETKNSKNFPISLLKNGKMSPDRKTLDLNKIITQGERDKRARAHFIIIIIIIINISNFFPKNTQITNGCKH